MNAWEILLVAMACAFSLGVGAGVSLFATRVRQLEARQEHVFQKLGLYKRVVEENEDDD